MSAPLPMALRTRFQELVEEGYASSTWHERSLAPSFVTGGVQPVGGQMSSRSGNSSDQPGSIVSRKSARHHSKRC